MVFHPVCTVGFHLDGNMHFCRFGFQRFGRHIGVGNAGGACRYSQHAGGKPRFGQRSFGHCLSAGLAGGLAAVNAVGGGVLGTVQRGGA